MLAHILGLYHLSKKLCHCVIDGVTVSQKQSILRMSTLSLRVLNINIQRLETNSLNCTPLCSPIDAMESDVTQKNIYVGNSIFSRPQLDEIFHTFPEIMRCTFVGSKTR